MKILSKKKKKKFKKKNLKNLYVNQIIDKI